MQSGRSSCISSNVTFRVFIKEGWEWQFCLNVSSLFADRFSWYRWVVPQLLTVCEAVLECNALTSILVEWNVLRPRDTYLECTPPCSPSLLHTPCGLCHYTVQIDSLGIHKQRPCVLTTKNAWPAYCVYIHTLVQMCIQHLLYVDIKCAYPIPILHMNIRRLTILWKWVQTPFMVRFCDLISPVLDTPAVFPSKLEEEAIKQQVELVCKPE